MQSRTERFIADSRWEMKHGAEFNSPTCALAEIYYKTVFEAGRRTEPGVIMGEHGKVAATIFQAEVNQADEWLPDAESVIPNAHVLVKNPNENDLSHFGSRNGLVLTGGYLFVCSADYTGFNVKRPVRGKNHEGYHYQNELRGMYETYINGLPPHFTPQRWGVRGNIKLARLRKLIL